MCGILGFTGKKDPSVTRGLLKLIHHRGFDDETIGYQSGLNYAMNRLAIVDLTKGYYPFRYKHFSLIYNGEIYNYPVLKKKLIKQKVQFKTHCDAEVILPLFDKYGPKAFAMLEGMFAICIIDHQKKIVYLSRDKSGEKPLYYSQTRGFSFASEMKVLLNLSSTKILDRESLSQYLTHGSVFGENTLVTDIKKVPPSHYLRYSLETQQIEVKQYWSPELFQENNYQEDCVSHLTSLIKNAVEIRLLADVPVGTFLSGGVDSSLVTYFAMNKLKKLKTFSISFPDQAEDESQYSQIASKFLGTEHTEIPCTSTHVRTIMEQIGEIIDEPISDPAILPTFLMSKVARKQVKVVLGGEGADELFGGYYRYQKQLFQLYVNRILSAHHLLPKLLQNIPSNRVKNFLKSGKEAYSAQNIWTENELSELLITGSNTKVLKRDPAVLRSNPMLFLQLSDYREYLPDQLLMKVDKITMQHNLEARAPFLDTKLINFAFNLKTKEKIHGLHNKYLLRKVAAQFLPPEIVWRLKHGFSLPLNDWFRNELKDFAYLTLENVKEYRHIFNVDFFSKKLEEHMTSEVRYRDKIWSIFVLTEWMKKYQIIECQ
ncbi:MAG: asparagine synthase (glutamine-hydrolyzing) [Patescibacteria group bacterium]